MIQLQWLNNDGTIGGGLYVRCSEIAAIYAVCKPGVSPNEAHVLLKSGRDFRTAQCVSELIDAVVDYEQKKVTP